MFTLEFLEKALVGAMLSDATVVDRVADEMVGHVFRDEVCGIAFECAYHLRKSGCGTSPKALIGLLVERGDERVSYVELSRLAHEGATQDVEFYLQQLLDFDRRFALRLALENALIQVDKESLDDIFAAIDAAKDKCSGSGMNRVHVADSIQSVAEKALKKDSKTIVPTGLNRLDTLLRGGFAVNDLTIVAARPSVGKTSLAMQLSLGMARTVPTLFISLEMSADDVTRRIIPHMDGPYFDTLRNGGICQDDFRKCLSIAGGLKNRNLYLSESRSASLRSIVAQIKNAKAANGVRAVVIDYLGFITHNDNKLKRWEQVGEITKALKNLARSEGLVLVLLSQLTRSIEPDERPSLTHLRESGSVEQDADLVLFIYKQPKEENGRIIEIAKNRNGELRAMAVEFVGDRYRFEETNAEWVG